MAPLPRFRIYTRPSSYLTILRDLLTAGVSRGSDCEALEGEIGRRLGIANAVCAPKARVGIFLAVRALIVPGQKVLLSPYTISDVVNMVICAGGVPVFADIEKSTCNIDPEQVRKLLQGDFGAVLVTHLHGLACDIDTISQLCREKGVPLIEDAAQAFGARWQGKPVGTFGEAGIFSYGMYKNVNSFFGGLVVTARDDVAATIRSEIESFPHQEVPYYLSKVLNGLTTDVATWPPLFSSLTFPIFRYGFLKEISALNSMVKVDIDPKAKYDLPESYLRRMTPMQARLVLSQLDQVDSQSAERIRKATLYHEALRDLDQLGLPPLRDDFSHIYTYFPIQAKDRRALLRHLMLQGRDVAAQHLKNCADLECFSPFHRDCPVAREVAASVVLLPTYPRYSDREVVRNIEAVRRYFEPPST